MGEFGIYDAARLHPSLFNTESSEVTEITE
jgi:hypothetical protein